MTRRQIPKSLGLLLLVVLSACANLKLEAPPRSMQTISLPSNLLVQAGKTEAQYKINIDAFHQKMSGLLLVKQKNTESVRMLMITEMGLKVFDVEYFSNDSIQYHYIMKHLDKPFLLNVLFGNLKLFWPNAEKGSKYTTGYLPSSKELVYWMETGDEKWSYFLSESGQLLKAERRVNGKKKGMLEVVNDNVSSYTLTTKGPKLSIRIKSIGHVAE